MPEEKQQAPALCLRPDCLWAPNQANLYAPFSFNLIINYTSDTKILQGIGSGVEFLGSTFSPFFFEYKRLFNDKKTTPFVFFRGGAWSTWAMMKMKII
jgi:hypothetical protein